MTYKKLAGSGRRSELQAAPSSHYTKESTMRKSILTALIAIVVMGISFASASADSHGQCNERFENVARSVQQEEHFLAHEGVLGEAESEVFAPAGFNRFDQTVSEWMSQRVEMSDAVKPFSGPDKGCENGHLFPAGERSYDKGKPMFWVLPGKYKKSTKGSPGNFSLHHTKTFSRRITIRAKGIAMPECGNPIPVEIVVEIWVEASHKKPAPQPKPPVIPVVLPVVVPVVTPTPTPAAPTCAVGQVMTASGCANQENHAEQHCLEQGGSWNTNHGEATCTITQVNGNCSTIIVINGSGDTVSTTAENCTIKNEPPPPTCADNGEVGKFPDCRPHTCEETGTCKPPPNCAEKGEVGTYPDCRPHTCEETGTCPPPPPPPPCPVGSIQKTNSEGELVFNSDGTRVCVAPPLCPEHTYQKVNNSAIPGEVYVDSENGRHVVADSDHLLYWADAGDPAAPSDNLGDRVCEKEVDPPPAPE